MKFFKRLLSALGILAVYFVLILLFVRFETEGGNESITNVWDGVWYSLVTLSTVGYGDIFPTSLGGKIVGLVFIVGSVSLLSAVVSKATNLIAQTGEKRKLGFMGTNMKNHLVIIGWNDFSRQLAAKIIEAGRQVAIVTNDKQDVDLIRRRWDKNEAFVLFSAFDDYDSYRKVNIEQSKMLFVNMDSDSRELVLILNLKEKYKGLEFIVLLDENDLQGTFRAAGVTYVLSKNEISSRMLASYVFEPAVADFTADLISTAVDEKDADDFDLQQFIVNSKNRFLGKVYSELFAFFSDSEHSAMPVGLKKKSGELLKIPKKNATIEEGDYVIFVTNSLAGKYVSEIFGVEQGER